MPDNAVPSHELLLPIQSGFEAQHLPLIHQPGHSVSHEQQRGGDGLDMELVNLQKPKSK